jgi:hypothetical protein
MKGRTLNRRKFFTILGAGGAALAVKPLSGISSNLVQTTSKPATNISDAGKNPRTSASMPGKFPGKVVVVKNINSVVNEVPIEAVAYMMLQKSMLELTGQKNLKKAWRITIRGTELQDEKGSFVDENGKLYGERNIDKDWYYWADVEGEYDAETMPYMVNGGKFSYFTKIVTQEVDKIINIPILKNAGGSITNAMKNLAFGSVSNTGRLHAKLWNDTCAEVCAFAPLRDKTVLNICDGLRGCFNGGPGANPQFICNYNSMLVSTDPVAMDRSGYDIIAEKRIAEGLQKASSPESLTFLTMADTLGLGVADKNKIDLKVFDMS